MVARGRVDREGRREQERNGGKEQERDQEKGRQANKGRDPRAKPVGETATASMQTNKRPPLTLVLDRRRSTSSLFSCAKSIPERPKPEPCWSQHLAPPKYDILIGFSSVTTEEIEDGSTRCRSDGDRLLRARFADPLPLALAFTAAEVA